MQVLGPTATFPPSRTSAATSTHAPFYRVLTSSYGQVLLLRCFLHVPAPSRTLVGSTTAKIADEHRAKMSQIVDSLERYSGAVTPPRPSRPPPVRFESLFLRRRIAAGLRYCYRQYRLLRLTKTRPLYPRLVEGGGSVSEEIHDQTAYGMYTPAPLARWAMHAKVDVSYVSSQAIRNF